METETLNRTQEIGRVAAVLLALHGERQRDLARLLGIDDASITRRIRDGRGSWTPEQLEAMADHFGVPISVLFLSPQDLAQALGTITAGSLAPPTARDGPRPLGGAVVVPSLSRAGRRPSDPGRTTHRCAA